MRTQNRLPLSLTRTIERSSATSSTVQLRPAGRRRTGRPTRTRAGSMAGDSGSFSGCVDMGRPFLEAQRHPVDGDAVVGLHEVAKLGPFGKPRCLVRAAKALSGSSQLCRYRRVHVHAKLLGETAHGGTIICVNPDRLSIRADLDLVFVVDGLHAETHKG